MDGKIYYISHIRHNIKFITHILMNAYYNWSLQIIVFNDKISLERENEYEGAR